MNQSPLQLISDSTNAHTCPLPQVLQKALAIAEPLLQSIPDNRQFPPFSQALKALPMVICRNSSTKQAKERAFTLSPASAGWHWAGSEDWHTHNPNPETATEPRPPAFLSILLTFLDLDYIQVPKVKNQSLAGRGGRRRRGSRAKILPMG